MVGRFRFELMVEENIARYFISCQNVVHTIFKKLCPFCNESIGLIPSSIKNETHLGAINPAKY